MSWKAENWRGKISAGRLVRCKLAPEERERGLRVEDVFPEGITHCAICGNTLWHYWEFRNAGKDTLDVGQECARIVTGGKPPSSFIRDIEERRQAEAYERQAVLEAARQRDWWRAPEQRQLRRLLVVGAREEWKEGEGQDFYRRARKAARQGRLHDKWQAWVERYGQDPCSVVRRTAQAMRELRALRWCRTGRAGEIVHDLTERLWPVHDFDAICGAPLSEKQAAMVARWRHRFRAQISKLEPWQRENLTAVGE